MLPVKSISRYIILLLITAGSAVFAGSRLVSNKTELEDALNTALPGDTIILKDQAWVGISMELNFNGTVNQPIVFRSETPGGASLESGSTLEIGGDHIVVEGLKFVRGYTTKSPIVFNSGGRDANHCRVTNCLIDNWNPTNTSTKFHWVQVLGSHNRIDHCRFSNMNHAGVTVMVKAGADQPGHHRIDHNYFGPKPEGDGNGYESIKMGGGDYSMFPLHTLVEKNYFYQCDGEVELISNKSWNNTYRYNTFHDCRGTITLRWGRECLVEGNYFFGAGRENTGGIRISDQDHVVINNYLENITGTDARAAISVMSGIPDAEGGDSGHGQTKNAIIAHNTMVNCKESMNIGYFDEDDLGDPRGEITAPENCIIANNIIWSSHAPLIREAWGPSINTGWFTNMAFGATPGLVPDSGMVIRDPLLEQSPEGIWRVVQGSPAVDSATIFADTVYFDFDGQERSDGLPDIGADELSDGAGEVLPVKPEDTGPDWHYSTVNAEVIESERSIQVYPNPAHRKFYLDLNDSCQNGDVEVEILNLSGAVVYSERFFNVSLNPEITVGQLRGWHVVRISCSEGVYYSKIIFN